MSERATSIGVAGSVTAGVATIAGSNRPEAAGHRFGPDLTCIECGRTWDEHQVEPAPCAPEPDRLGEYAARIDDGL